MHGSIIRIDEIEVHRDEHGRFSLNDLHRAAVANGANARTKEPAKFLASPHVVDLVKELETTQDLGSSSDTQDLGVGSSEVMNAPVVKVEGRNGGTYVCRELVYAYAMWISAAFHLKVIRTFDAVASGRAPPAFDIPKTYSDALRLAADQAEQLEQQRMLLESQAPKVASFERFLDASGTLSLRDTAKTLGLREQAFIKRLLADGILYRVQGSGRLRAYAHQEETGRFVHRAGAGDNGHAYTQPRVTPAGLDWLSQRYTESLSLPG